MLKLEPLATGKDWALLMLHYDSNGLITQYNITIDSKYSDYKMCCLKVEYLQSNIKYSRYVNDNSFIVSINRKVGSSLKEIDHAQYTKSKNVINVKLVEEVGATGMVPKNYYVTVLLYK